MGPGEVQESWKGRLRVLAEDCSPSIRIVLVRVAAGPKTDAVACRVPFRVPNARFRAAQAAVGPPHGSRQSGLR